MDKIQTLAFIKEQIVQGVISSEDIASITHTSQEHSFLSRIHLNHVLYTIGGIVVCAGVAILIGQNWHEIGFAGRVLVSLGLSLILYILALFVSDERLSSTYFVLSAIFAPLGVSVVLSQYTILLTSSLAIYTSLALALVYGYAFWKTKREILVLCIIAFSTFAYVTYIGAELLPLASYSFIAQWATILLGLAYIAIGFHRGYDHKNTVAGILYGLGTLGVLGAGITIGGWFDVVFVGVLFVTFYASVFLKSRAMLIFSSIFLMAHIIKITSKYFVDSIGWPLALIMIGFLLIGVGYGTYRLGKKYLVE